MRCHFVYDEQSKKKVLIPGCYGSLYSEDKSNCCCPPYKTSQKQFEKEEYNKTVSKLRSEIEYLHQENNHLHRIIQKLT